MNHRIAVNSHWLIVAIGILGLLFCQALLAEGSGNKLSISIRNTEIQEVYEMISKKEQINILLGKEITGKISVNLYNVSTDRAIRAIANAAGYTAELSNGSYTILTKEDVGKDVISNNTQIKTFKVQYSDPKVVIKILTKHISRLGKITLLDDRQVLVIEDQPEFLARIETLLSEIDKQPKQILIEAKILEITLDDSESFGLDWTHIFNAGDGTGRIGAQGFAADSGATGFFFSLANSDVEAFLNALDTKGRVRTLSTPKLLTLENQEAQVVIGDRIGFKVTTTINAVTTESIEFLESGIILKVTPSVDQMNRILMDVHPEVSNGTLSTDGIPSQTTTEVTTQLLAESGESIFIGGLIKNTTNKVRTSVPVLGSIPVIGSVFSKHEEKDTNTETVVLITPYIINGNTKEIIQKEAQKVFKIEEYLPPDIVFSDSFWQETLKKESSE